MDLAVYIETHASDHLSVAQKTFEHLAGDIAVFAKICSESIKSDHKLLFFGNGGSAADAQHIAAEFVGRLKADRKGLAALALTTDTSALTAIGNDYGYDHVFSRQVEALGHSGDVAVGLSTSGQSANVVKALQTARARGLKTIGLTGQNGGALKDVCDVVLMVPSDNTMRIQEMHIFILHVMCAAVEKQLGLVK